MFGAGGGTSSYREVEETDLIVLWGSNARETHPIFFHHVLRAVNRGARLIVVDPRRTGSAEWADLWLGLDVGSDIALANAVGREIIAAGLANDTFIERATSDFEAYRAGVEPWTLAKGQSETGVPADAIRELAHAFATADRAMICWTLGITEHHNAVDNVLALISLALLTGHVGRYGSGLNPLRGQNNVQGGGDMGALPDRLPGFQHVENDALRAPFDKEWGVPVPPQRGWHLSGMFDAMERGDLTAVYVIGENPVQSEADQKRAKALLGGLEFMVVQDSSSPRPPSWPTWCCLRRRRGPRAKARSPTRNAACSACARPSTRPARRATTWPSSSSWPTGWATIGASRPQRPSGTRSGGSPLSTPA